MQHIVDVSTWTREQIVLIKAAVSNLAYNAGVTHDGITTAHNQQEQTVTVTIANPDPSDATLTDQAILNRINDFIEASAIQQAAQEAEWSARSTDLEANDMRGVTLQQAINAVDNIANLEDAKDVLRKLARLLCSKGILD